MAGQATTFELTPLRHSRRLQYATGFALVLFAIWIYALGGGIAFLAAILFSLAFFAVAYDEKLLLPAVPTFIAIGIGLLPQTIFLLWYNQGFVGPVEPTSLLKFVENYEDTIVKVHNFLATHLKYLSLLVLAFGVLTTLSLSARWANLLNQCVGSYATWISRGILVLLGAATFTLLSPVDSANWTADLPRRIDALLRIEAMAEVHAEVAQQFIAQSSQPSQPKVLHPLGGTANTIEAAGPTSIYLDLDKRFVAPSLQLKILRSLGGTADEIEANAPTSIYLDSDKRYVVQASQPMILQSLVSAADYIEANAPGSFYLDSHERRRIIIRNVYYAGIQQLNDNIAKDNGGPGLDRIAKDSARPHSDDKPVDGGPTDDELPTIHKVRLTASAALDRYENSQRLKERAIEALVSSVPLTTGYEWFDELLRPFAAELVERLSSEISTRTNNVLPKPAERPVFEASLRAKCEKLVAGILKMTVPVSNDLMSGTVRSVKDAIETKQKEKVERRFEVK
jgi:hypothetical protein